LTYFSTVDKSFPDPSQADHEKAKLVITDWFAQTEDED